MTHQVQLKLDSHVGKKLGQGCFGSVYQHKDSNEWVIKSASSDGTRTYLEWCYARQQAGNGMRGMPKVAWVVETDADHAGRYLACMRRLPHDPGKSKTWSEWLPDLGNYQAPTCSKHCPAYLKELISAFHRETGIYGCDMHYQNFMVDRDGTIVLTDPDAGTYHSPRQWPINDIGWAEEPEGPMVQTAMFGTDPVRTRY